MKFSEILYIIIMLVLIIACIVGSVIGIYGQIKYRNTPTKDVPYWVYAMNQGGK